VEWVENADPACGSLVCGEITVGPATGVASYSQVGWASLTGHQQRQLWLVGSAHAIPYYAPRLPAARRSGYHADGDSPHPPLASRASTVSQRNKPANPFYALLVMAGVALAVTGCIYAIVLSRAHHPAMAAATHTAEHPLFRLVDRHGTTVLLVELAVLGGASILAMATDRFWTRRAERSAARDESTK